MGADVVLNRNEVDVAARDPRTHEQARRSTWYSTMLAAKRRIRSDHCSRSAAADVWLPVVRRGGPVVDTDVRRLFWNQWSIMGSTMGNDDEFDAIVRELWAGRLMPPVDSVYDLKNGRAAFERLQSGEQFGKVVVRVS